MQDIQEAMPDFFIDYHDADVQWARWIAYQLENAHYTVFYREQDIRAGSNKVLKIDDVLQNDVRIIVVLSPDYLRKDATTSALFGGMIWSTKFAIGGVLPVRVRDCLVQGLLSPIELIDLVGYGEVEARQKLLNSLTAQRKPLTEPPVFPGFPDLQKGTQRPYRYPGNLPLIWNVPARNRIFTDRDPKLTDLYEIFKEGQEGQVLTHVIKGLGGVGKTQVAIEYAYRYSHRYDAVLWIDVSNEQTFIESVASVEKMLTLQEQAGLKIVGLHNLLTSQVVVKQWLQALSGAMRWLLILDNLADFALINDFIPSGGNGHILITARAQATGIVASASNSLLSLSPEDGALLLLRRTGKFGPRTQLQDISQTDLVIAQELSYLMGSLPLALDQAGAYIEDVDLDLPSYLNYYNDNSLRRILLEKRGEPTMYHPDPVAITWNDAFALLREFNPVAYSLLLLCSFLHPDAIPEQVLTHGVTTLPIFQAFVLNPLQRDAAYADLRKYSLLVKENLSKTFSMHRMVQVVLHDSLSEDECRLWAERAISAVYTGLLADEQDELPFHHGPRYFFHVQKCLHAIKTWGIVSDESALLLSLMGKYLHDYAQNSHAGTTIGLDAAVIIEVLDDYVVVLRKTRFNQEAEQIAAFSDHIRMSLTPSAAPQTEG